MSHQLTGLGAALPSLNDCWNKIGVAGDASCPELQRHVHCRNCPTYAAAAAILLDRDLPSGYLSEWSLHYARKAQVGEPETESVVIFRIGVEWLALPTSILQEVAGTKAIHTLPGFHNNTLLGLTPIHGELIICVSLARVLGLEESHTSAQKKEKPTNQRLLVAEKEGWRLSFPVDEVHGIQRYALHYQQPVPATVARSSGTYTKSILSCQDKSVALLDDGLLFHALNRSLS
jgi:chemotaxis-related protein WspD